MKKLLAEVNLLRKKHYLTQIDFSDKAGVGLRFVREMEQGKETNRILKLQA